MIENEKIKLSALIVIVVIFIAYMKQYLFYYYFNIDVSNYIDLSEVLTPFVDNLGLISGLILLEIFLIKIFDGEEQRRLNKKRKKGRWLITQFYYFIVYNWLATLFIVLNLGLWIYFCSFLEKLYLIVIVTVVSFLTVLLTVIVEIKRDLLRQFRKTNESTLIIFFTLYFTTYLSSFIVLYDIENVDYTPYPVTAMLLSDSTLVTTDSTTVILGRTKHYVFILEKLKKENADRIHIYPTSSILKEYIVYVHDYKRRKIIKEKKDTKNGK